MAALAARATVPVSLDIPPTDRLPAVAEQTAYFTIAESLANIAKHSGADQATVSGTARPATGSRVTIVDNGVGGAHIAKGHGLAGRSGPPAGHRRRAVGQQPARRTDERPGRTAGVGRVEATGAAAAASVTASIRVRATGRPVSRSRVLAVKPPV